MGKHGLSDSDLAGLTEQERAVMEEEDEQQVDKPQPGDAQGASGEAQQPPAEEDEEEEEPSGDVAAEQPAADPNEGAEPAPQVKDDEQAAAPAPSDEFQPSRRVELNDEQKARMAELAEKFDAGEINTQEYLDARDAVRDEAIEEHVSKQRWEWECSRFLGEHKQYQTDPVLFRMWDAVVRDLGAKEEHANKSGRWFLDEAHRLVSERTAAAAPQKPPTPPRKPAPRSEVPVTLSDVPPAAPEQIDEGEFASLQRLIDTDPLAAERAIARMSPEKQQRFLETST